MTRPSWDQLFMRMAYEMAERATCPRKHVGAVIVRDRSVLSAGYNGSIRGAVHCTDDGCMMVDGHCVRTVHAEANAIIQAARHGTRINGSSIYCTALPCWPCFKLISNSGITEIIYDEEYRKGDFFTVIKSSAFHQGMTLRQVSLNGREPSAVPGGEPPSGSSP
jgi:dCMP deaminase